MLQRGPQKAEKGVCMELQKKYKGKKFDFDVATDLYILADKGDIAFSVCNKQPILLCTPQSKRRCEYGEIC